MRTDIADEALTAKRHGDVELAGDDLQRPLDPRLPHCAEAIDIGTADVDATSAERESAEYVLPRADATVEMHFDAVADSVGDSGELADGRGCAVELPPAVVGDDDRVGAGSEREPRILGIHYALEDQLAAPLAAEPLDVGPRELEIELAGDPVRHRAEITGSFGVANEIA